MQTKKMSLNLKMIDIKSRINIIENNINNISQLIDIYKKEVKLMEKNYEIDFDGMEEIDLESMDQYIINDSDFGVKLLIADETIRNSIITGLVISGYRISADGNIILIENGREKFR